MTPALEAGRYVNTRNEIVEIAGAVQAAAEGTVLHELGEPLQAPVRGAGTAIGVTDESTIEAVRRAVSRSRHGR